MPERAQVTVAEVMNDNSKYCLARPGEVYVVYLPGEGTVELDLEDDTASFRIQWFNPREGGVLQSGRVREVKGPGKVSLGHPPMEAHEDWVALIRR